MKKILFLSVLFLTLISGFIISCSDNDTVQNTTKNDGEKTAKLTASKTTNYPVITKYLKNGSSGQYNVISDGMIQNIVSTGLFDSVTEAYITYYTDQAIQEDKAYMVLIGSKNNTAKALSFQLSTNNDGFFEIEGPDVAYLSNRTFECTGTCSTCTFVRDSYWVPIGCTSCPGGACNFKQTETEQEGMTFDQFLDLLPAILPFLI